MAQAKLSNDCLKKFQRLAQYTIEGQRGFVVNLPVAGIALGGNTHWTIPLGMFSIQKAATKAGGKKRRGRRLWGRDLLQCSLSQEGRGGGGENKGQGAPTSPVPGLKFFLGQESRSVGGRSRCVHFPRGKERCVFLQPKRERGKFRRGGRKGEPSEGYRKKGRVLVIKLTSPGGNRGKKRG